MKFNEVICAVLDGVVSCWVCSLQYIHVHTHTHTHTHCDDGTDAAPVLFIFCRGFIWRCVRTPNESSSPQTHTPSTNQQLGHRSSANQQSDLQAVHQSAAGPQIISQSTIRSSANQQSDLQAVHQSAAGGLWEGNPPGQDGCSEHSQSQ